MAESEAEFDNFDPEEEVKFLNNFCRKLGNPTRNGRPTVEDWDAYEALLNKINRWARKERQGHV